jgi:hypothetical protein
MAQEEDPFSTPKAHSRRLQETRPFTSFLPLVNSSFRATRCLLSDVSSVFLIVDSVRRDLAY